MVVVLVCVCVCVCAEQANSKEKGIIKTEIQTKNDGIGLYSNLLPLVCVTGDSLIGANRWQWDVAI